MATWIANFMIGQVFPIAFAPLVRNRGTDTSKAYSYRLEILHPLRGRWLHQCVHILVFFFPETKGRTLEEMDHYFRTNHWFVLLGKGERISAQTRERELTLGTSPSVLFGAAD